MNTIRGLTGQSVRLAAILSLSAAPAAGQARRSPALPLDSAQIVQVLEEAAVAFRESSDSMRANDRFREHLRQVSEAWGVEWDPEFAPRPLSPGEVVDSLVALGDIDGALRYADGRSLRSRFQLVRGLLEGLAVRGLVDESLSLADSIGSASRGIYAVLDSATPDSIGWRWKVDRIARFIRDEATDTVNASGDWATLNYYLAEHDFAAAWTQAGEWEPESVTAWRIFILDLAFDQDLPTVDSLFLDTYERARSTEDAEVRNSLLTDLEDLCEWKEVSTCNGLDFPINPGVRRHLLRYELQSALAAGRYSEVEELGVELRELVSAMEYALIVARGLERGFGYCSQLVRCGRVDDSLRTAILPRLDRIASESADGTADSLNVRLAALWAERDLKRARAALERIESPEALSLGLHRFAMSAYRWDREAALQAFQELGSARVNLLENDHVHFMSWADTARADEILNLMESSVDRMRARLAWARRIQESGRWEEARRLAATALDEWNPSAQPMMGSRGPFNLFWKLGSYEDVIAWARARPDPDDRTAALAAAIGTLPRPGSR